ASASAGYYFLYPDRWTYVDKGPDVEVDSPGAAPGNPAAASPAATPPPSSAPGGGGPKILVHEAQTSDALGQLPTLSGHQLTSSQVEVYGITTVEHTYSVTDPVYKIEADVKLTMSSDHALLLTLYTADSKDL